MYIILVAGSATCRKSTAINLALKFLKGVEPPVKILSQKLTPEAMISALSGITIKDESKKVIDEAVGCFINDELSTLIDRNAFQGSLIPILTKLYDCQDFEYETKARGAEAVKNPCLSILGGSTIQWIREAIPVHAIGGGFTSRIVFVFRAARERSIPWPKKNQANIDREKKIIHDLSQVAKLRGEFGVTDDAIELFSTEYITFLDGPMSASPYLSGYTGRRHVTLLKLAMAMSASRCDDREITKLDMWRALQALRNVEGGMDVVMKAITSEPIGDLCEQVMALIMVGGSITRQALVREVRHRMSVHELDTIIAGLLESGHVKRAMDKGLIIYKYKKEED